MQYDVILIGAGLANGILATFLKAKTPGLRVLVVERDSEIATSRTWCFHEADLTEAQRQLISPLVMKSWDHHFVDFPRTASKRIASSYFSLTPRKLQAHLQTILGKDLLFGSEVTQVKPHEVHLKNGKKFTAPCVVDGRGMQRSFAPCGFQKFIGLHIETLEPHGLEGPVLMDATIPQLDGYRFFYVLPWAKNELLIEDTRYSNSSTLDPQNITDSIHAYAHAKGWHIKKVLSSEAGVLPIPLQPLAKDFVQSSVPAVGMLGGFFHPVTGYSLPDSVRIATLATRLSELTTENFVNALQEYRNKQSSNWSYLCLLNRMMFTAAEPSERYRIFKRFYSLDNKLIERFYRGQLLFRDKARILMGKPPVPFMAALKAIPRATP